MEMEMELDVMTSPNLIEMYGNCNNRNNSVPQFKFLCI